MIDHHAMAVHPELIAMCEDIVATQSAEIEMMQMWSQDWYRITYELDMHMGEMEGHMKMDPAQFEERFMKHIISNHAAASKEAEDCLEEA